MQKTRSIRSLAAATVIAFGTAISGANAADVDFSGKTITMVVGFGAGGGYDAYGRLAADHIGRFLPGNPTIVVENSRRAASICPAL
ncbi:MAG: hypothetical protein GY798_17690 [Hyphomicrobiales bacterium]|nr:hypothetical protein [Hyphomicrobiales bacterium]